MNAYRPPRYEGLGAHVSGVSARVLTSILERAKALDSIQRIPAEARAEVLATYDSLRAAAIYWNEQQAEQRGQAPAPQEPAEEAPAPAADDLSAAEAAEVLGCTERRVRQLLAAERLQGRRVAGRWLVDAGSVGDYLLAREAA
ncbi:helix-turn-helix domain-containing protein [Pseudarthrobacter oxydans]|uniref:helix-turn-helix domain-containing protein n=1 Tax=Pseudarthrobacter oxydans TaxID=1671 RepID=UPI00157276E3|nr:helix-turn-helix domain-containing protein [Pseudarthrobacter oxydans]NSX37818.1 helix-turn-helix domain-containing protein [Pseudarthrobacter oxydans]